MDRQNAFTTVVPAAAGAAGRFGALPGGAGAIDRITAEPAGMS
jgi:hypothetical protein